LVRRPLILHPVGHFGILSPETWCVLLDSLVSHLLPTVAPFVLLRELCLQDADHCADHRLMLPPQPNMEEILTVVRVRLEGREGLHLEPAAGGYGTII
jgi:hypothetical protein